MVMLMMEVLGDRVQRLNDRVELSSTTGARRSRAIEKSNPIGLMLDFA